MNKGQKLIASLLALSAVLLTLNFADGQAEAQNRVPVVPTVVGISTTQVIQKAAGGVPFWRVFRAWSDGTIDHTRVQFLTPSQCSFNDVCGPAIILPGTPGTSIGDLNGDGCVDAFDLSILLAGWCSVAGGNPCGSCQ